MLVPFGSYLSCPQCWNSTMTRVNRDGSIFHRCDECCREFANPMLEAKQVGGPGMGLIAGGLCRDCRHWGGGANGIVYWSHFSCTHPDNGNPDAANGASDGYGGNETQRIQVGPDFGCIHFEGKQ